MKKILFIFNVLFLLTIGAISPMKTNADEFYEMINYLDLSNLDQIVDGGSMAFKTVNPIRLKKGITYTLIVDEDTLGRHSDFYNLVNIAIKHVGNNTTTTGSFSLDIPKSLYYYEFEPQTSSIHFDELPVDLGNDLSDVESTYNIMLYEGKIQDFIRFEKYVDPLIGYHKGFVPIDYDNQLTESQIKNLIKAESATGQNITVSIEYSNYENNKNNSVGTYEMNLVANIGKNYRRFSLIIQVIDIVPPVINGPSELVVGIENTEDPAALKKKFSVSDNADKTLTYNDLIIEEETFSNVNALGEYMMLLSLTDSSGNRTTKNVTVLVQDNRAPIITGPNYIYLYSSSDVLSNNEILGRFTAFDLEENEYKDITITKNDYSQKTKAGVYAVTLTAKDRSNNVRNFNLRIYVIDDTGPIFKKDELVLTLSEASQMTNEDLIAWFNNKIQLTGESVSNVQIIYNEYENNKTLGGTYNVYFQYERAEKIEQAKITINVEEQNKLKPINLAIYGTLVTAVTVGLIVVIKKRK